MTRSVIPACLRGVVVASALIITPALTAQAPAPVDLKPIHAALQSPLAVRAEHLRALIDKYPPLFGTPLRLATAHALLERAGPEDRDKAAALLRQGGDPRFAEINAWLFGRSFAEAGNPREALKIVAPFRTAPRRNGRRLRRATLGWAIAAGDMATAVDDIQALDGQLRADERTRLIRQFAEAVPRLPPAELAELSGWVLQRHAGGALEDKLMKAITAAKLPDPRRSFSRAQRWNRCEKLSTLRHPELAVQECAGVPEQSGEERLQVARWQRQFGDTVAAARLLDELARTQPGIAGKPAYLFERHELARATGEKQAARTLLLELANRADSDESGRAQLMLYLQSPEPAEQAAWLRRYIDNPAHGKDWAMRTLALAIDEFTAGRHDAALDWAQRLVRAGNPHDDLVHGALYLQGRILEARKQPGAAEIYANLSRDDRYGYYGMIARRRAGLPALPPLPPLSAAPLEFQPEPGTPGEAGDLLLIAGFTDWAVDFYREAGGNYRLKEALATWLQRDYSRAATLARARVVDSYSNEGDTLARLEWQLIYPVAYTDALAAEAPGGYVEDPLLTLALIRQESFFRADVVSSAGAIGLMQLMPTTAVRVARQMNLSRDTEMLYDPGHNVQLGRRYFADLLTAFGEPAYALIGYNAGPGRVPQWRKMIGDSDLDLFIERIPFKETRSYVRRILLNWQEYRRIYGDWNGARAASLRLQQAPWSQPWPAAEMRLHLDAAPPPGIQSAK